MTGRALLPLAIVLALLPGLARADWKRDYVFGQQAFERGDWSEAEKLMRAAAAEEPGASARKRFQGSRFDVYVPAHYAGVAAFRQGACDRAVGYLRDEATRGIAAGVPALAAQQQEVMRGCEGRVAAAEPARPEPTPAAPVREPEPRPATPDPVAANPPATGPARPPAAEPAPVVRPPPASTPTPAPATTPPPATVAKAPPPAALRGILGAYVAGNYATALRASDAGITDARARSLLLMVRAASGFTLAEMKGGDAALVAQAQRDVRTARQLARIEPDPNLFSPKVRAQFSKVR